MKLKSFLKYKHLVLISALCLSSIGAYFSVYGIGLLFSSKFMEVSIMAIFLEVCKVVTVGMLSIYWKNISKKVKVYLVSSIMILSFVTSVGVYSFLSSAYQENSNKIETVDKQKELLQNEKENFSKNITQIKAQIKFKEDALVKQYKYRENQENALYETNSGSKYSIRLNIKNTEKRISDLESNIDSLNKKVYVLNDSVSKYEAKTIELEKGKITSNDVGTLKYISKLTGINMDKIVNYLILLLIIVFDPLAIALIASTNSLSKSNSTLPEKELEIKQEITEEEIKKTNEYIPDKDDVLIPDISDENIIENVIDSKNELPEIQDLQSLENSEEIIAEEPKEILSFSVNQDTIVPNVLTTTTSQNNFETSNKQSLYLTLLEIFYENGDRKGGDESPSYLKFKESIDKSLSDTKEKDIKDFLIICNLLKITEFKGALEHFEKDYDSAMSLISRI